MRGGKALLSLDNLGLQTGSEWDLHCDAVQARDFDDHRLALRNDNNGDEV